MADFSSLFIAKTRSILGQTKGGTIEVDATLREDHISELEVAENPIDFGADITDHVFLLPLQLTVIAGVSNTPLGFAPQFLSSSNLSRAEAAFEELQLLQSDPELLEIQSGLRWYKNMILVSLSAGQDADTDKVLVFTAVFREMILVGTEEVGFPKDRIAQGDTQNRRASNVERGKVGTPEANLDVKQNRSLLFKIFN